MFFVGSAKNDLKARGVDDILIACIDGLKCNSFILI